MEAKIGPPGSLSNGPLLVIITREMYSTFYTLWVDESPVEELEVEDVREWFKQHGANMDVVNKALDQCWNFTTANVEIEHPREPSTPKLPYAPEI